MICVLKSLSKVLFKVSLGTNECAFEELWEKGFFLLLYKKVAILLWMKVCHFIILYPCSMVVVIVVVIMGRILHKQKEYLAASVLIINGLF